MGVMPKCLQHKTDCFGYTINGKCCILDNTRFKEGRECPFYKPESAVSPELLVKKYEDERAERDIYLSRQKMKGAKA